MVSWILCGFTQFVYDSGSRGNVRVAEAEVNDVFAASPRLEFQAVNGGEHIGRERVDATKVDGG